jgi:hypothetical protein
MAKKTAGKKAVKKPEYRKIVPCGMFATPESMETLQAYCNNFTGPGEKIIAFTVAGMTWNLAARIQKENEPFLKPGTLETA